MSAIMTTDLRTAIDRAGGQSELARRLGLRQQSVSEWISRGVVPPARVLDVERATGIHRHLLNPNIYPDPPPRRAW